MTVLPDIEQFAEESPQRTLLRFFEAIDRRRYGDAVDCCCFAIRGGERQHKATRYQQQQIMKVRLEGIRYDEVEILGTEYRQSLNPEQPGTAFATVTLRYRYSMKRFSGQWADRGEATVTIVLIRENRHGVAMTTAPATWGVVPHSMRPLDVESTQEAA